MWEGGNRNGCQNNESARRHFMCSDKSNRRHSRSRLLMWSRLIFCIVQQRLMKDTEAQPHLKTGYVSRERVCMAACRYDSSG